MARVSKKKKINPGMESEKRPQRIYRAGIYARLSVDGRDCEIHGNKKDSIEAQIEIAKAFIRSQKDMILSGCYTDTGKTGTNFDREGFVRMMQDVRTQKIDCIVVKDLSRFGRNHIETGNYIEKIFPFLGVRLIAVTDNFDSICTTGQNEKLGVNLKNLVNEMYAKDIAIKVKSSRQAKREQGSYMGGVAPYGYFAKQAEGKRCLFSQKITSDIVKNIFYLFLSGKSIKEISVWLYEEGVVSPSEYHKTGETYCRDKNRLRQWPEASIKMVLTNPVYMGCLVWRQNGERGKRIQRRSETDSGNWSVKSQTHEAIIDEEMFYAAAQKFKKPSGQRNKSGCTKKIPRDENIFAGILYCGNCGLRMKTIASQKKFCAKEPVRAYRYNCPNISRIDAGKCISKSITQDELQDIIKEAVRWEVILFSIEIQPLVESNKGKAEELKEKENRQLSHNKKKIGNIKKLESEWYLRYRAGDTDQERFKQIKEENRKKLCFLQKQQDHIAEKLKAIDCEAARKNQFLRILENGNEVNELQVEAAGALISKIKIYQDHRVEIIFSFKGQNVQE